MPYGDGTHVDTAEADMVRNGIDMLCSYGHEYKPTAADENNYVSCKEDLEYEELCTLEGLLSLFEHDNSLDEEINNLKEDCLLNTIHELEERTSDVLTLMFYVKSEKVPADKVDALLKEAIKNPMSLLDYIDEADKSKYDVNMLKYVEDVEGEW